MLIYCLKKGVEEEFETDITTHADIITTSGAAGTIIIEDKSSNPTLELAVTQLTLSPPPEAALGPR